MDNRLTFRETLMGLLLKSYVLVFLLFAEVRCYQAFADSKGLLQDILIGCFMLYLLVVASLVLVLVR